MLLKKQQLTCSSKFLADTLVLPSQTSWAQAADERGSNCIALEVFRVPTGSISFIFSSLTFSQRRKPKANLYKSAHLFIDYPLQNTFKASVFHNQETLNLNSTVTQKRSIQNEDQR